MIRITTEELDDGLAIKIDATERLEGDDYWWQPAGGGNIGCMFKPMNPETVGISQEAVKLIEAMPTTMGDLGHIDMFKAGDEFILGWLGGPVVYHDPQAELSNDFRMPPASNYTLIPNS